MTTSIHFHLVKRRTKKFKCSHSGFQLQPPTLTPLFSLIIMFLSHHGSQTRAGIKPSAIICNWILDSQKNLYPSMPQRPPLPLLPWNFLIVIIIGAILLVLKSNIRAQVLHGKFFSLILLSLCTKAPSSCLIFVLKSGCFELIILPVEWSLKYTKASFCEFAAHE